MNRRRFLGGIGALAGASTLGGLTASTPKSVDAESFPRRMTVPGLAFDGGTEPLPTLRALADSRGVRLGTQPAYLFAGGPEVQTQLPLHFNAFLLELYMQFPPNPGIHPAEDEYNFNWPDFVVAWSSQRGIEVHGHNLAWGTNAGMTQFTPDWVKATVGRDANSNVLRDWIRTLVARYPQVTYWTVVNEPWSHGADDLWLDKIGDDYPLIAARAAREANPAALLILNDFGNHVPGPTADANYELARRMIGEGLLDGIGFQMHLDASAGDVENRSDVVKTLSRFSNLKNGAFEVEVTEIDVNLHGYGGTRSERWLRQAIIYQGMFEALLEAGGSRFFTMGNTDALSWLNALPNGGSDSEGTLFAPDWSEKPAYGAVHQTLRQLPATN